MFMVHCMWEHLICNIPLYKNTTAFSIYLLRTWASNLWDQVHITFTSMISSLPKSSGLVLLRYMRVRCTAWSGLKRHILKCLTEPHRSRSTLSSSESLSDSSIWSKKVRGSTETKIQLYQTIHGMILFSWCTATWKWSWCGHATIVFDQSLLVSSEVWFWGLKLHLCTGDVLRVILSL